MANSKRTLPGIHIQWPWSQKILSGEKAIETRSYDIPERHRGKELVVIETPGPQGKRLANIKTARMVGIVTFAKTYRYKNERHWASEIRLHCVASEDPLYAYKPEKPKWAWVVSSYKSFSKPLPAPKKRGIIFATSCSFPTDVLS